MELGPYKSAVRSRPAPGEQPPATLDWNLWNGPAPARPYSAEYHPRRWRNWWDFGGGALGDIGCHTMDAPFYALDLGAPEWVQADCAPTNGETFPDWSVINYQFPARGPQPPVRLTWHDGGKLPPRPPGLEPERTLEERYGYYFLGDSGVLYDPSEKCASPRLLPEARMREAKFPPKTIPRVPGGDPFKEWIAACKGGPVPGSSFEYAAPLTEAVMLGNVALRAPGRRLSWDAANLRLPDAPELERHLRAEPRVF
jgi:predicted dehydrogenase